LRNFLLALCLNTLCISISSAQNIEGTWEGDLGGDEFLQINVVKVGNKVCGYTWDRTYRNRGDYCKAYFNGSYNSNSQIMLISGYSFMENSGGHVLMQLKVRVSYEKGEAVMVGFCRTTGDDFLGPGAPMEVSLKKVSNKPAMMTQTMEECVKAYKDENKPIIKPRVFKPIPKKVEPKPKLVNPTLKKVTTKPKDTTPKNVITPKKKDSLKTTIPLPKKIDTTKKKIIPPVVKQLPDITTVPLKTNGRTNKEISRIIVTSRKLKLEVYDNGTIDGDTVTIYYNGKIIMDKKRLSITPFVIDLDLDEKTNIHSVVMFAQNLGSIPPNTALIIVTTPERKRYELYASANLNQNAALIFEYKPK
jgi:hypothetical protein